MRRIFNTFFLTMLVAGFAIAQTKVTTVSGKVKTAKTNEVVSAVSVTIKGGTKGSFTDDKGNFSFTTTQKPPFTLVFSSVGYSTKEVNYTGSALTVDLETTYTLGTEVTVSASRVSERVLESPVTIERVNTAAIRNAATNNYYDMLTNLKGVDVVTASLTFRSVGTRGFNSSGNLRLNQIVDGMDNQAPGLNFAVGNIVGVSELDVESMELLPGASSALYGPGGMNGTVLINAKDPFKYQGLSFQVKVGANHADSKQRDISQFHDWSLRYAKKVNEKLAYKFGFQLVQAKDWVGTDQSNYLTPANTAREKGMPIGGTRETDPNYDGVNVYGDETTQNMSNIANSVRNAASAAGAPIATLDAAAAGLTLSQYQALFAGPLAPLASFAPILYGSAPSKNYFNNQSVSRTGYMEKDIIDPTTVNVKLSGALHYKFTDKLTGSLTAYYGTGNTVYTGSDRYSLKNLKIGQYKMELRSKNWYLRAYTTQEDAGDSYNATITTRLFNESWKASGTWYPQYMSAYSTARSLGAPDAVAHANSRAFADQGRPTGQVGTTEAYRKIAQTPIKNGGGLFVDKSTLWMFEGQWNLTEAFGLDKMKTDVLIGGNSKQYILNSQGTLFADTAGKIKINELGAYIQVSQKLINDKIKITGSARYDKNSNFAGKFTPRVSVVGQLAKDHNMRVSYQTAYRFPSTQNQWINLLISGGTRLMGGVPELRNYYNFNTNPVYTLASFQQFAATGNPALLKVQEFGEFKPESMTSIEVGYKGLIAKKLLIDAYYYSGKYKDFLGSTVVIQSNTGTIPGLATSRTAYSITTNLNQDVTTTGWGLSAEYQLPLNFNVSANVYSDEIGAVPSDFVSFFNTPKTRANFSFGNTGFLKDKRCGFNIVVRTQESFYYQGTFGSATLPSYTTVDAMFSYKFPEIKSLIKFGGTNIYNKYYRTGFGSPAVGGLYYVSFGYNIF